jgi:chitinase
VTNCPLGSVTTDVITLYTTICPVTATETSTPSVPAYITSTVYTTIVYTITSCAATVTNCPGKLGSVTTEIISLYTTVCPVTETETSAPVTSSTSAVSAYTSPIPTSATVVKTTTILYSTSTVKAASSTVSKFSNSTSITGTGAAGGVQSSTLTLLVSPTPSHIYSASGASKMTGSFMALVILAGVALFF